MSDLSRVSLVSVLVFFLFLLRLQGSPVGPSTLVLPGGAETRGVRPGTSEPGTALDARGPGRAREGSRPAQVGGGGRRGRRRLDGRGASLVFFGRAPRARSPRPGTATAKITRTSGLISEVVGVLCAGIIKTNVFVCFNLWTLRKFWKSTLASRRAPWSLLCLPLIRSTRSPVIKGEN